VLPVWSAGALAFNNVIRNRSTDKTFQKEIRRLNWSWTLHIKFTSIQTNKLTKIKELCMNKPNISSQQHQSNKTTAANSNTQRIASAGEYIYNTMIPQSKAESAEVPLSFSPGKIDRRTHNGLHLASIDLNLRSDDFNFAPTGDGGVQISNAKPGPVTSSDFVARNFLLPTGAPLSRPSKLERVSTGDSILKDEKLGRITSGDWNMEEFRDESSIAMKQLLGGKTKPCVGSLCSGLQRLSTADMDLEELNTSSAVRLPSDMSSEWINDFKGEQAAVLEPIRPSLFDEKAHSERKLFGERQNQAYTVPVTSTTPTTTTAASTRRSTKNSSSSTAKKPSKKKKKKREIDEGHVCVPTDDDVLFGRGGYTNSHPGNIRFREKALELRPVYERSSKEEKFKISQILLDSIMSDGARFLEKGQDGEWHQVKGNGARKKASQALRERIKGTPRRSGTGVGASLTSSLTSVKSVNSQSHGSAEAYLSHEINGDILAV